MKKNGVLIIGSDGLVGRALFQYYQSLGNPVFHTTRRQLDLTNPNIRSLPFDLHRISHAILAAGNTKLIQCQLEPASTFLCNVTGTLELARQLSLEGVKPILFSSDYVFDGKKETLYTEEDLLSPLNEYGKQKAEIETRIPHICPHFYLIVRLAKVYSLDPEKKCWVASMASMLKQGQMITAAKDQIFCPIFIDDVVRAIHQLQTMNACGIYNLGGEEVFNRYEIAQLVGRHVGSDPRFIRPISLRDLNEPLVRPTMTGLSSTQLIQFSGMRMQSIKELIDHWEIDKCLTKV